MSHKHPLYVEKTRSAQFICLEKLSENMTRPRDLWIILNSLDLSIKTVETLNENFVYNIFRDLYGNLEISIKSYHLL